jgi:hypothetical protein
MVASLCWRISEGNQSQPDEKHDHRKADSQQLGWTDAAPSAGARDVYCQDGSGNGQSEDGQSHSHHSFCDHSYLHIVRTRANYTTKRQNDATVGHRFVQSNKQTGERLTADVLWAKMPRCRNIGATFSGDVGDEIDDQR